MCETYYTVLYGIHFRKCSFRHMEGSCVLQAVHAGLTLAVQARSSSPDRSGSKTRICIPKGPGPLGCGGGRNTAIGTTGGRPIT